MLAYPHKSSKALQTYPEKADRKSGLPWLFKLDLLANIANNDANCDDRDAVMWKSGS